MTTAVCIAAALLAVAEAVWHHSNVPAGPAG
jgi:hypothetical protein